MCSNYTYKKNEAKLKLRDRILVYGAVPRANIRPTDLGPVIIPEYEGFACREMRWGWAVPWDKGCPSYRIIIEFSSGVQYGLHSSFCD